MESIKKRTSIRKYADSLLEEAMRTPTMGNLQLYSVVVTRSEEGKKALAPAHFNQPMVTGAPVVLTICADYRRTTLWAENRKGTPGYDNILSFMNAATDALLFTQVAETGDAGGYPYHRMAGRTACPERPSAIEKHHTQRAFRGLYPRKD